MPEKVEFLKEKGIIKVESFGKIDIQDLNASVEKMQEIRERERCRNVLVDVRRQESMPSMSEMYRFGERFPRDYRIALVTRTNASNEQKLFKTVTVNRGKHVRLFTSDDKAISWLSEFAPQDNEGDA